MQIEDMTNIATTSSGLRVEPLGDTVVFRAVPAERTNAGLYLAESGATAQQRMKAIVVSVGPGKMRADGSLEPVWVKPGDRLVLREGAQSPGGVDVTGETLYICRVSDIAAIVVQDF